MRHHLCLSLLALVLFTSPAAMAQDDVATSSRNDTEQSLTAAESCRASCERDYTICSEEGSAARDTLNGRPSANLNGYRCGKDLTACLDKCRGL